jgi:chemotaxis protein methyltransferase CheR
MGTEQSNMTTQTLPQTLSAAVAEATAYDLTDAEFKEIGRRLHRLCGIQLDSGKEGLVKSRLIKRLRTLGLHTFDEYLDHIDADRSGQELVIMIDSMATNKTSFFREDQHFDFMGRVALPALKQHRRPIRIWSAGCSSGEEPFTIAMVLAEGMPDLRSRDVRILATDISTKILMAGREATYTRDVVRDVPAMLLGKYFKCIQPTAPRLYRVNDSLRAIVRFARLNLIEPWPMKGPFDFIFCRNTMIYFDKPTRQTLVQRFWNLLRPEGHLFVGHSESLTGIATSLRYVQPAVYTK